MAFVFKWIFFYDILYIFNCKNTIVIIQQGCSGGLKLNISVGFLVNITDD